VEDRAVTDVLLATAPELEHLTLLSLLPPGLREMLIARFVPESYPFGRTIVTEGDQGDALYVITSGRARVVKRDERGEEISLSVLRPGDSFGEIALLTGTRRMATVRAASDVEALRLDRTAFDDIVARSPELRHHLELQVRHRTL
jgi:CRP-like cAMP-binding protein